MATPPKGFMFGNPKDSGFQSRETSSFYPSTDNSHVDLQQSCDHEDHTTNDEYLCPPGSHRRSLRSQFGRDSIPDKQEYELQVRCVHKEANDTENLHKIDGVTTDETPDHTRLNSHPPAPRKRSLPPISDNGNGDSPVNSTSKLPPNSPSVTNTTPKWSDTTFTTVGEESDSRSQLQSDSGHFTTDTTNSDHTCLTSLDINKAHNYGSESENQTLMTCDSSTHSCSSSTPLVTSNSVEPNSEPFSADPSPSAPQNSIALPKKSLTPDDPIKEEETPSSSGSQVAEVSHFSVIL